MNIRFASTVVMILCLSAGCVPGPTEVGEGNRDSKPLIEKDGATEKESKMIAILSRHSTQQLKAMRPAYRDEIKRWTAIQEVWPEMIENGKAEKLVAKPPLYNGTLEEYPKLFVAQQTAFLAALEKVLADRESKEN